MRVILQIRTLTYSIIQLLHDASQPDGDCTELLRVQQQYIFNENRPQ